MQQNGNNSGEKAPVSPRSLAFPPARPIVMKFGGTSVADAACLRRVVAIINGAVDAATLIVVVSALAGVTDQLVACAAAAGGGQTASALKTLHALRARHEAVAAELLPAAPCRAYSAHIAALFAGAAEICRQAAGGHPLSAADAAEITGLGERLAAPLLASALAAAGRRSQAIAATELISLDPEGEPNMALTTARCRARLRPLLQRGVLPVVTGFICRRHDAAPATLGRGGSDYSATLVAACMHAREAVIWTDVDGVHDADPRLVPAAQVLPALSYQDAALLARAGAKVLHPQCLAPARAAGIPLSIRNTFRPERPGTQVTAGATSPHLGAATRPLGLAARSNLALVAYRDPTGEARSQLQARAWPALADDAVAFRFLPRDGILQIAVPDAQAAAVLAVWRWALRLPAGDPRLRLVPGVALVAGVGGAAGEEIHARATAALRDAGVACLASAISPAPEGVAVAVFQSDLPAAMTALHRGLLPPVQHPPEDLGAPAPAAAGGGAETAHHRIPASPVAGDNRREA